MAHPVSLTPETSASLTWAFWECCNGTNICIAWINTNGIISMSYDLIFTEQRSAIRHKVLDGRPGTLRWSSFGDVDLALGKTSRFLDREGRL